MLARGLLPKNFNAVPNDFFTRIEPRLKSKDQISSKIKWVKKPTSTAQDL
ncbi:MAG: hypothetical protein NXI28_18400 [bacterium]|nr:hypothetical protein [bacterium]